MRSKKKNMTAVGTYFHLNELQGQARCHLKKSQWGLNGVLQPCYVMLTLQYLVGITKTACLSYIVL